MSASATSRAKSASIRAAKIMLRQAEIDYTLAGLHALAEDILAVRKESADYTIDSAMEELKRRVNPDFLPTYVNILIQQKENK